jgi:hypothetical protein
MGRAGGSVVDTLDLTYSLENQVEMSSWQLDIRV